MFYTLLAMMAFAITMPWILICLVPVLIVFSIFSFASASIWKLTRAAVSLLDKTHFRLKMHRPRILVVDDDYSSVLPLISMLENGQSEVEFVSSGKEMIRKLMKEAYDLVLLDSQMPNMNGEAALEKGDMLLNLKRSMPVIFFSSNVPNLAVPRGLKQFAVRDLWQKGDLDSLQEKISQMLPQQQLRLA